MKTKKGLCARGTTSALILGLACGLLGAAGAVDNAGRPGTPDGHPALSKATASPPAEATRAKPAKLVDINNASKAELKTLPGVGDVEAAKIIANRPFMTKVDLVTLKILPEGVYVAIKDRIVATQSGKPLQRK